MNPDQRANLLHKVADGIDKRFEDFVAAEVADTGRPEHQARTLDVFRGMTIAGRRSTSATIVSKAALPAPTTIPARRVVTGTGP